MTKLISLFLLLVSLAGNAQNSNNKNLHSDKNQSFSENDYSISYPDNWDLNKSGLMGTKFILLSPLSSENDKFRENVNLIIQDLSEFNLNLDDYLEISENQIKALITDSNILESSRKNTDSSECHKVIYTGKQGIFDLKFEQFYWVQNNKAYVLTLTCESNKFTEYQTIGEEILNSFKIN